MASTRILLLAAAMLAGSVAAFTLLSCSPPGEVIAGRATIPRPGVVEIDGAWVHLIGIRPPREDPDCRSGGAIFECTLLHRARLAEWTAGGTVTCDIERFPGDHRIWGVCRVEGRKDSLNRELARSGWAFVDTHLTPAYAGDVDFARRNYNGMWAGFIRQGSPRRDVLVGGATVKGAGVIEVDEINVHLLGVDAPPVEQTCELNGLPYQCGVLARAFLETLTNGTTMACEVRKLEGDERVHGVCGVSDRAGQQIAPNSPIVNELVVAAGWALAEPGDLDYREREAAARGAGLGLWSGEFVAPSAWTAGQR